MDGESSMANMLAFVGLLRANCIHLLAESTIVLFHETWRGHSRAVRRFRRSDYTESGKWTFAEVNIAFDDWADHIRAYRHPGFGQFATKPRCESQKINNGSSSLSHPPEEISSSF